jgi:hypothetical protein
VISGRPWFETEDRPFVLRVECPLAVDEVVAVLYGTAQADDMASDEDLCGYAAVALLIEGLQALQVRAEKLRADEGHGVIASPAFLALCRQRVAALIGR